MKRIVTGAAAKPAVPWTQERLKRQVAVDSAGCWLWQGWTDREGYGRIETPQFRQGAHRVSYELWRGPIPGGLVIDHLCRVRHCVNPDHLEPVTEKENILRGQSVTAANARKTHCKHGHEFTTANTYVYRGGRHCRACNRAAVAKINPLRDRRKQVAS